MHACLDEKHRRHKATGTGNLPHVQELRWKNVVGEASSVEYDSVLDVRFGESGSVKREVFEMRACCSYVSQALRQVRPGLEGWNKHSLNMNLEEMLVAIGEPVKRWRRKEE